MMFLYITKHSDSLKKSFEDDVKYLKKELNVLREEATK